MSIPINEEDPLNMQTAPMIMPCSKECGECSECIRYVRAMTPAKVVTFNTHPSIKSRAEFYQIALREEGEAKEVVAEAQRYVLDAQRKLGLAQEALNESTAQLILTRDGLFKACGL